MSDPTVVPPLLGLGTPTQISTKNRSHHKRRNPTKKTLTNATKLTPPLQLLNGWGDPLQSIDDISTLRVVYQNVNGFSKSDPSSQFICQQLRSIQCGVFLAAETNINWRNKKEFELFKSWGAKSGQITALSSLVTLADPRMRIKIRRTYPAAPQSGSMNTGRLECWSAGAIPMGWADGVSSL
jgi:hypothetical protein